MGYTSDELEWAHMSGLFGSGSPYEWPEELLRKRRRKARREFLIWLGLAVLFALLMLSWVNAKVSAESFNPSNSAVAQMQPAESGVPIGLPGKGRANYVHVFPPREPHVIFLLTFAAGLVGSTTGLVISIRDWRRQSKQYA